MRDYHARHISHIFRIGDRFLGYSSSGERWAVLEATSYCPDDPTITHFNAVSLLPKCDINPRAWDVCIFQ